MKCDACKGTLVQLRTRCGCTQDIEIADGKEEVVIALMPPIEVCAKLDISPSDRGVETRHFRLTGNKTWDGLRMYQEESRKVYVEGGE